MKKTAVVLLNLGGPDNQNAVKPFLFNLFSDPAIIRLPQPFRFLIAKMISGRRENTARAIYAKLGGGSPILKNTEAQARALEEKLGPGFKCFISMSYWHPFADETVCRVKTFAPDEIILLPLYPQFSTTSTEAGLKAWNAAAKKAGLKVPARTVCCYPRETGFITALAANIRAAYALAESYGKPRLLLSAHGLPEKIVKGGDPYQWQCERTADALVRALNIPGLDAVLCYQSRVGPLRWIGPSTDSEVLRAAESKLPIVIAPIAFVSEHSETLVEIDMEYRDLAHANGSPFFAYAPAVAAAPEFIDGLAKLVHEASARAKICASDNGGRICPAEFGGCICRT